MAWSTILSEQVKRPWGREVGIQGYWPKLQFNDLSTEVNFLPCKLWNNLISKSRE